MFNEFYVDSYEVKEKKLPFGYYADKHGKIHVDFDKSMLIREIYRLFLLHETYKEVCIEINYSENFPNHPYTFTIDEVKSILHEHFYTGDFYFENPEDNQQHYVFFHHKSIVPDEIWYKVQGIRRNKL